MELVSELGALPEGCSLTFSKDLATFNDQVAKGTLERLNALFAALRENLTLGAFQLRDELSSLGSNVLQDIAEKLRISSYLYRDIESPYYIQEYQPPEDIQVEDVYRTQDDIIVECNAQYDCTIEGFVFKSDAYDLEERDVGVRVTDWNWNEHYAEVEFHGTVRGKFLVRLAEDVNGEAGLGAGYSVESIEVLEALLEGDEY